MTISRKLNVPSPEDIENCIKDRLENGNKTALIRCREDLEDLYSHKVSRESLWNYAYKTSRAVISKQFGLQDQAIYWVLYLPAVIKEDRAKIYKPAQSGVQVHVRHDKKRVL